MQKDQRKAEKKDNKEGIKLFCSSLKKKMLYANKTGRHLEINMTQKVKELPPTKDNYVQFAEGDRMITVMIQ